MSNFKSYAVLLCSFLVSVLTVVYCGYIYVDIKLGENGTVLFTSSVISASSESYSKAETTSSAPVKNNSSNAQSSKESVTVGADLSNALGKIYEQAISPYSAKLSYNNVYIKNTSGATIDIKSELEKGTKIKVQKNSKPQVLIIHTHATECFMEEDRGFYTASDKTRTTDNNKNITHLGEIIADKLNKAGISTLHDKKQHDYPSYTGSYTRSAETVKEYLKKYPSIKIVIDLHRDSISLEGADRAKPTVTIDGKKAAQIMLCMGSETGTVTGYPNWKENLRFAMKYHQTIEALYPGIARPLLLRSSKYNQNLSTGSILLEIGTESNTLKEVEYSATLAAEALINLLNTMV